MRLLLFNFYLILSIRKLIRVLLATPGRGKCNLVSKNPLLEKPAWNKKILLYETLMIQVALFIRSLVSKIWAISVIRLLLLLSIFHWLYRRLRNHQLRMNIPIEKWINLTIRLCYLKSCWKIKVFKALFSKKCWQKQTKIDHQLQLLQAKYQTKKTFRINPTLSEKTWSKRVNGITQNKTQQRAVN